MQAMLVVVSILIVCTSILLALSIIKNAMINLKERELKIQDFKYKMSVIYDKWHQDKGSMEVMNSIDMGNHPYGIDPNSESNRQEIA